MWRSCCRPSPTRRTARRIRTRAQIAKWTKAEADKVAYEVMKCATQEEVFEILKRYER